MHNFVHDLNILYRIGVFGVPRKAPRIVLVHWIPPLPSCIKVNTNGAFLRNLRLSNCGFFSHSSGDVFFTHWGFFKGGFAYPMGLAFAFEAKILVIILAVEYACYFNWNNLWIESDSSYVVHLLLHRSIDVPWSLKAYWSHCLASLSCLNIHVSHVYREGNKVDDDL